MKSWFVTLMLTVAVPLSANAADTPVRALPHAAAAHAVPSAVIGGPHRYFGTLQSVNGSVVTILLRSGRLFVADATQALAAGHWSAPLYVGKPTVIYGAYGANGQFFATIVKRAAPQIESWGRDL